MACPTDGAPETYHSSTFDLARLSAYARRVAKEVRNVPPTRIRWWEATKVRSFFGSKISFQYKSRELDGWVLVLDREEGRVWPNEVDGKRTIIGWEDGRFLMLTQTGDLLEGRYRVEQSKPISHTKSPDGTRCTLSEIREANILHFDRLNEARYRKAKPRYGVALGEEHLGTNFRISVPKKGMKTSLALKALKERKKYYNELVMGSNSLL